MATKYGRISSIKPESARARVVFDDADGMVSAELPIVFTSTSRDKFYHMPKIGEQVVVDVPEDSHNGDGVILGSYYSDKQLPECQNPDKWHYIEHDNTTGDLKIICSGHITINGARIDLN